MINEFETISETATSSENTAQTESKPLAERPLLYDKRGAAAALNISPVTLQRLLMQGRIKRVPGIRKILIPRSELEKFARV